jgi:hypothetical protein
MGDERECPVDGNYPETEAAVRIIRKALKGHHGLHVKHGEGSDYDAILITGSGTPGGFRKGERAYLERLGLTVGERACEVPKDRLHLLIGQKS